MLHGTISALLFSCEKIVRGNAKIAAPICFSSVRSDRPELVQMIPSSALAYARIGSKINPKTRLTLDVFNLFDRRASDIDYFYQSRLRGKAVGGVSDLHFHPVEPRSLRLTLAHNF